MPYPSPSLYPGVHTYPGFVSSPSGGTTVPQGGTSVWAAVLCSSAGVAQHLMATSSLVYRRELNRTATLKVVVPLDSDDAYVYYEQLAGGLPQARLYQDGVLRFSGLWAPASEQADADTATGTLEFRDPLDLLAHRYTGLGVTLTGVDAGQIAWQLIDATDHNAYLTVGDIEISKLRDRTYDRKLIAEAIIELTEVIEGFDFFITPLDYAATGSVGRFDVYAQKGTDRSGYIILEHGRDTRGTTQAVARQVGPPINRATVVGDAVVGFAEDTASQAIYGVWETLETVSDISEQATVDDRAASLLRPQLSQSITFTPEPTRSPVPFVDYDVGDTIAVRVSQDSLVVDTTVRVLAIEIELDENGVEVAHRVEVGDQRPRRLSDMFREVRTRLNTLEAT
jgi:hypothetical protein